MVAKLKHKDCVWGCGMRGRLVVTLRIIGRFVELVTKNWGNFFHTALIFSVKGGRKMVDYIVRASCIGIITVLRKMEK